MNGLVTDSASPAPYPQNGEEQQAAVRRRALPIGIAGAICGIGGLTWLLAAPPQTGRPPNMYAVNLSFCAMLMGIGIIFYARHTKRTRAAVVMSVAALLAGVVGTMVFTKQTVNFKVLTEAGENGNILEIERAAESYANIHGGEYPMDLATIIENKLITTDALHSPYEAGGFVWPTQLGSHDDIQKMIVDHSDFQYFGKGLKAPAENASEEDRDTFGKIIIVAKKYPIARKEISIGYGDQHVAYVGGEDWEKEWDQSNVARRSLGFQEISRPTAGAETTQPATRP